MSSMLQPNPLEIRPSAPTALKATSWMGAAYKRLQPTARASSCERSKEQARRG